MKKAIALLMAVTLMVSLAACGKAGGSADGNPNGNTNPNANTSTNPTSQNGTEPISLGGEIAGEITVSCYDTTRYKNFLEDAAKSFEAKYPGTTVTIDTFSAMPEVKTQEEGGKKMSVMTQTDDPQSKSDYVNKINTELMSGKGADILAIDVLPSYKYANNGQLENLKTYMDSDPNFNLDDYRANIFDALADNSGMYVFPIDYSFTYFAYDSSLFTDNEQAPLQTAEQMTFEKLAEIGKEPFSMANETASEPINMFSANDNNLFQQMFNANYSSFVDIEAKKANFTDGAFTNLLNTIKEYSEDGYIKQSTGGQQAMTPDMLEKSRDEQFFFKPKNSVSLLQEFNKNSGIKMMMGNSGNEENDKISGLLANDKGESSFAFNQAYGINSNSKNKQTAWEFIKFLTSEEMQTSLNLMGMPVNYEAFLEKTELSITGALYNPENAGKELDESGKAVFDSYVSLVNRYTSLLNTYFMTDSNIDSTVNAEVKYFFDGSKTAEEVAQILQSKISLYLNE